MLNVLIASSFFVFLLASSSMLMSFASAQNSTVPFTPPLTQLQKINASALFMKSNSTGKIYAHTLDNIMNNVMLTPLISPGLNEPPFPIDSKNITITAEQNSTTYDVTYTITAKNNTKGVFFLRLGVCVFYSPLVVGLNESQVNPVIFYDYLNVAYECPARVPSLSILGYSGIISKAITFYNSNITAPLPQKNAGISSTYPTTLEVIIGFGAIIGSSVGVLTFFVMKKKT